MRSVAQGKVFTFLVDPPWSQPSWNIERNERCEEGRLRRPSPSLERRRVCAVLLRHGPTTAPSPCPSNVFRSPLHGNRRRLFGHRGRSFDGPQAHIEGLRGWGATLSFEFASALFAGRSLYGLQKLFPWDLRGCDRFVQSHRRRCGARCFGERGRWNSDGNERARGAGVGNVRIVPRAGCRTVGVWGRSRPLLRQRSGSGGEFCAR